SLALVIFVLSAIVRLNLTVAFVLFALYLYSVLRGFKSRGYTPLNALFLFMVIFSGSYLLLMGNLSAFYIPYPLIPMLATLLFANLEISFLLTVAIAVAISSLSTAPFQLAILFLLSGIVSSFLALDARKRTTVIRAGVLVGLIQAAALIFWERFNFYAPLRYGILFLNGIISSWLVLGILPIFEYLFSTVTNISLLELADFNHPLLQQMIMDAPGTYHHSLIVGNLSESACNSVGANALLARIGAYYHDIGKLSKPEYFSENQELNKSKHDDLAPTMSRLVIMNHVREGMEMAKKYKINPAILDFIQQHHGKSLVYYFYRRALEELEEDQEIKEEGFRYPGPKPNTKETAIVLLADSVEAATRALKNPAPVKIEEVVRRVINNKFIDGQLDECELTLKDLEKISTVFIRILSGIYHSRVSYPEETKSGNNRKKLSEENTSQPGKDKKDNS
ncbi:MAG: HDIG domain-containing protein, partial [Candidatus Omnitrophica bacterium]|nr:HDIG domain-containing protein [Candidatus Omnitrophota bacterium]